MSQSIFRGAMLVWGCVGSGAFAAQPAPPRDVAPPRYVHGQAFHILPETHSDESGYFSLCEGKNGKIYVGTAKYGENAYLVEFDPQTEKQRIVIDVHRLCGLTAQGFAAQAKIHTRNFVGPSGVIYVGSKQGYRRTPEDKSDYPGGYVMTYDPAADKAENLGMPFPGQGIADVVADESRGLLYIVTCEDQHWMRYDMQTRKYRELGPLLASYMTTLVDGQGRAHSLTKDGQIARYDPASDKVTVVDLLVDGKKYGPADVKLGPTYWNLAADRRTAYLIRMTEPSLLRLDLAGDGPISGKNLGPMLGGKRHDNRCALDIAADGRVYAIYRVDNETGFGQGYLHHLVRYDPAKNQMQDLGVLAVKNPNFFTFTQPDGKPKPWSHGYHKLPDGTMTPLHAHMGLISARDGTLYATIIYPFTLLKMSPIP